jgi:hypothetical protein
MMAALPLQLGERIMATTSKSKSKPIASKATKSAKAKPAPAKKVMAAPPQETKTIPVGECPKGGDHEWNDGDGDRHCGKCMEPAPAKTQKAKATAEPSTKKMSAIDAAAKLLAETGEPLNCKAMIEAIAAKGYWTSPGGKTPHATLYSAIIREIKEKGNESRFVKKERGLFAASAQ